MARVKVLRREYEDKEKEKAISKAHFFQKKKCLF